MTPAILIVDDEFGLAEISADVLGESGYEVELAINGALALEALERRMFDLVITDLMMPVMDGIALIKALAADARFATIPCVLMTALPEAVPPDGSVPFAALLVKPYTIKQLLAVAASLTAKSTP